MKKGVDLSKVDWNNISSEEYRRITAPSMGAGAFWAGLLKRGVGGLFTFSFGSTPVTAAALGLVFLALTFLVHPLFAISCFACFYKTVDPGEAGEDAPFSVLLFAIFGAQLLVGFAIYAVLHWGFKIF